jgi:hypothetical protein
VKDSNHDEMNRLTQFSKINIFTKIFISERVYHDEVNHLTQISKINIFINISINGKNQPR